MSQQVTALLAIQIGNETWGWTRIDGRLTPCILINGSWNLATGFPPLLGLYVSALLMHLTITDKARALALANQPPGEAAPRPPTPPGSKLN